MQRPELASTSQYIAWHARRTPDAPAVAEGDLVVSYRGLAEDIVRCVAALEAFGVVPDTLVCVEHQRRYAHLVLLLACEVIGAATISLTVGELAAGDDVLRHSDFVLSGSNLAEATHPKIITIPADWFSGRSAGPPGRASFVADLTVLERAVVPNRPVRIARTSGTTGAPKAIVQTFAVQQLRIVRTIEFFPPDLPPRPNMLCMYHLATGPIHRRVLTHLQLGGTVLFALARHAWPLIAAGAVHSAAFAVGDIERSIRHATPPPDGHPLHVMLFGAAVSPALRRQVRERLRATLDNSYASNETNLVAMMDDDNVGTLGPGVEVRIVDEKEGERPYGVAGLIRIRCDYMFNGYLNDPQLTAAAFVDGWYVSGDAGMMPAAGKLVVLGRADDMLNIGGVKVPPVPIEARIKEIDGVSDAAVLSIANENGVESLVVVVETSTDTLTEDLRRRVGAIVMRFVGVFTIVPMRTFPRTESGKVRRPEIEAEYHRHRAGAG
jgi:acyl-coenzyme A synthetase/AMP-(fatty) acid ligase